MSGSEQDTVEVSRDDGVFPLDKPTAGEVLRTVHGVALAMIAGGVAFAALGVIFYPFSGGFLDPASAARTVAPWLIALGIITIGAANVAEYARQTYRIEEIEESTEADDAA